MFGWRKRLAANQKPKTGGYKAIEGMRHWMRPRDLPEFNFLTVYLMLMEPTIRLGLAMRAAPLCVEFEVDADDDRVAAYVLRQLRRVWSHGLSHLLSAQTWGWAAVEVVDRLNEHNLVEIDRFLLRHARDVLALERDGDVCGVRFERIGGTDQGYVDLEFPHCIWHAYKPEPGSLYGMSVCEGAYSPWADKWLNHGALDVRRLFMTKNAYGGDDLAYPEGEMEIPGKGVVPCRDVAREIVEQSVSGNVTTRPSTVDANGNELWKLTRATVPSNPTHILQYPKDLDTEMFRGLEIPDDVLESDAGGAWAGKQVPMAAFYAGLDGWLSDILGDIDTQAIQPRVALNFGPGKRYSIKHKPLAQQAHEQQGRGSGGPSPQSQSPPQQPFGLDGLGGGGQPSGLNGLGEDDDGGDGEGDGDGEQPGQRLALDRAATVEQGVLGATKFVQAAGRYRRMANGWPPATRLTRLAKKLTPGTTRIVAGITYRLNDNHRWARTDDPTKQPTTPPLQLTGNEFDLSDRKQLRKNVMAFAKQHLIGRKFTNQSTGHEIGVSSHGIEEALKNLKDPRRALVIARLPEIFKQMEYHGSEPPDEDAGSNVKAFHHYSIPIELGGKQALGRVVAREDDKGKIFYTHNYIDTE